MGINGPLFYWFLPLFLALIAWEVREGRKRGLALYTKGETLASIGIGVGQRLIGLIPLSLTGMLAVLAYEHRFFTLPMDDWRTWAALFVLLEFTYYWFHRASHEVRWFWTTHAVHHSLEELNVLGAYRLGWTNKLSMGYLFHIPLMLIGFTPASVATMLALNLFYQSWLHTVLIGRLGPLEGVLNTPSAHRVHHAKNADYLDRNYGGVTVIFDRLFGTYQAERDEEPCAFGLVKPVGSTNVFAIAFHEWGRLLADLRAHGVQHWPGLLFGPPGWRPNGEGLTAREIRARYRAKGSDLDRAAAPAA
jgi:sterol desaturase/sphingolipid hydroxylase (fatty acid hydroxylase superfamily)